LDGFGFLVPAVESRKILGTIWSSTLFHGRAPEGHVALTTFIGGARQPQLVSRSDSELVAMALRELESIMGVEGTPAFVNVLRWEKAIPQYNLGYQRVIAEIEETERGVPGLFLCSNYRGGIAVGDCVMNGKATAERVAAHVTAHGIPQSLKAGRGS
jgi:oxygen-dependent protoporphyrinogen oxidase